jgi:hypothetical protein
MTCRASLAQMFFAWLESLGWQAALCFAACAALGLVVAIFAVDAAIRKLAARVEQEAAWNARKAAFARRCDAARKRQFSAPRDFK